MAKKLKIVTIVLAVLMLLSWVIGGFLFWTYKGNMEETIVSKDNEITMLNDSIIAIGELVPVYSVVTNVSGGQGIQETDLELIEVPVGATATAVTDLEYLLGMYYKTDISAGAILTSDIIYEEVIEDDMRYLDVYTHVNPVGLQEGSFVDVRLKMPYGEDYVVLSHKKVLDINNGILKLIVDERDIYMYNSMLIDSVLYTGCQIYSIEYVEGGIQAAAEEFYPVSDVVLSMAQKNPNMLNVIEEEIMAQRALLEATMDVELEEKEVTSELATLTKELATISSMRNTLIGEMSAADSEWEKAYTQYQIEQAALAEQAAQG